MVCYYIWSPQLAWCMHTPSPKLKLPLLINTKQINIIVISIQSFIATTCDQHIHYIFVL